MSAALSFALGGATVLGIVALRSSILDYRAKRAHERACVSAVAQVNRRRAGLDDGTGDVPPMRLVADRCQIPPVGWWCSRERGHDGPCAARTYAPRDPQAKR